MIKLTHTSVMNMENAMRGARNPLNSWARMDSGYDEQDRKSTRLNSSHSGESRMPSSA